MSMRGSRADTSVGLRTLRNTEVFTLQTLLSNSNSNLDTTKTQRPKVKTQVSAGIKQSNKIIPYHIFHYHTTPQINQTSGKYHTNTGKLQTLPGCRSAMELGWRPTGFD